ncbi:MAG: prepilin peptidase [Marichromatium sp.]|nr:prepilin peptidase [Marichromatium sp.]
MEVLFLALLGVCVGSFLNVLIYRLPLGQNIAFPASHCPSCKTPLRWYHNIPLFSWMFLGGKCATCKASISFQYPLVELITGGLFFLTALKAPTLSEGILLGVIFSLLLALSVIDLRYKAVPDMLSLPTLALAFFVGDIVLSLEHALLFAGGFALLRILISAVLKKEAMGEADIIIAGIIGAVVGIPLGLVAIYLGAVLALPAFYLVSKKGFELPFIPFLSLGLFISYLFQAPLLGLVEYYYG